MCKTDGCAYIIELQRATEMKKPILIIMAAGMGSRYGGLKQIDPVNDQTGAVGISRNVRKQHITGDFVLSGIRIILSMAFLHFFPTLYPCRSSNRYKVKRKAEMQKREKLWQRIIMKSW